jgi:hypothetical protein
MDKFKELVKRCKSSVEIRVNEHKDYYQTVEEYIKEDGYFDNDYEENIGSVIYDLMKKKDTIVVVTAYPDSSVGSYTIYHHDIDTAVETILDWCNVG